MHLVHLEGGQVRQGLTDDVVQVVDDHLGVAGGVHGALQERRPRAQLGFLRQPYKTLTITLCIALSNF